jgi:hypothetical protein
VFGLDQYQASVRSPEDPGPFYFPPIATLITSAAKLMLVLLEHEVTRLGGSYAFCDTDSMAIVARPAGGLIPCHGGERQTEDGQAAVLALSWEQGRDITRRFASLNPYDRAAVPGSILELKEVNFDPDTSQQRQLSAYAISAKRYALYTLENGNPKIARVVDEDDAENTEGSVAIEDDNGADPEIVEAKEHGLGHLLHRVDPEGESRDWISELWEYIVYVDGHGLPAEEPDWLGRPAITRPTTSKPRLLRAFDAAPRRRAKGHSKAHTKTLPDHPEREVRPYNFLLAAHVDPLDRPPDADPHRFQLVAPYNRDPGQWRKLTWTDAGTGGSYRIVTGDPAGPGEVQVKTYREILEEYRTHPEAKSAAADHQPCDRDTKGLLGRRHVTPAGFIGHIGKEGRQLGEREAGLVLDPMDVTYEYDNPADDTFETLVVPVLRQLPVAEIAQQTGLSERTIKRVRADTRTARRSTRGSLTDFAVRHARRELRAIGIAQPVHAHHVLAAYRERRL